MPRNPVGIAVHRAEQAPKRSARTAPQSEPVCSAIKTRGRRTREVVRISATTSKFSDHFTPDQERALFNRIQALRAEFPSIRWVKGHYDFANKACPDFDAQAWYRGKLEASTRRVEPEPKGGLFVAILAFIARIFG